MIRKSLYIITLAFFASIGAMAQNTTGYFLDDYTYGFMLNPAVANSRNFVALPVVGNIDVSATSNLSIRNFFYNVNGSTVTFMHPDVSAAEVMKNIKDNNSISNQSTITVLACGFRGLGGYNTIALNLHESLGINLPGSLFSLLKEGVTNNTYDIGRINAYASAYGELSFGHSHEVAEGVRVGANVKLLLDAGYVKADMKHTRLNLSESRWVITTDARIDASINGLEFTTDVNKDTKHEYVDGAKINDYSMGSLGMAVDLGATYSPQSIPELTFSASLFNLGFIRHSSNHVASTNGQRTFNTDEYVFNVDDDAPNSFNREWNRLKNDLTSLYELDDMGNSGSYTSSLGATLHTGACYKLPSYRPLSFGVLATRYFNGDFSLTQGTLSVNWAPCKVFDMALSGSVNDYGAMYGMLLNLHCPGFNLFAGACNAIAKYTNSGIPSKTNTNVNCGVNILF